MLRSMYSGISGMKNFQTKLDVIGNNIANVNTYGFKKGRVVFKDILSQNIAGASAPGATRGGVNPRQVGLGSQLAAIDTIDTTGSPQTTGRTLDLALSGDGYFMVGTGEVDDSAYGGNTFSDNPNISYTRAGNFYFDEKGFLVNSDGLYLIGLTATDGNQTTASVSYDASGTLKVDGLNSDYLGAIRIPRDAETYAIGADGIVTYTDKDGVLKIAGIIGLGKFANNGGLEKIGENLYKPSANSGKIDTDDNGVAPDELFFPGLNGASKIVSGALEMSNVDLSEEFTEMIVAQRGFQANTKIITTSDEILQELVNLKR